MSKNACFCCCMGCRSPTFDFSLILPPLREICAEYSFRRCPHAGFDFFVMSFCSYRLFSSPSTLLPSLFFLVVIERRVKRSSLDQEHLAFPRPSFHGSNRACLANPLPSFIGLFFFPGSRGVKLRLTLSMVRARMWSFLLFLLPFQTTFFPILGNFRKKCPLFSAVQRTAVLFFLVPPFLLFPLPFI